MSSLTARELEDYRHQGWVGPFPLLDEAKIRAIHREYFSYRDHLPWYKGHHVYAGPIADALLADEVVRRVEAILGPDLLLWGSQVMDKRGGLPHRWHVDVETMAWRSVNFWAALRNVSARATVLLLPGTHRIDASPQELERTERLDVNDTGAVVRAARARGVSDDVVTVDVPPGHFVLFDGHLWHGSVNRTWRRRTALLAQYSPTTEHPRIPRTYVPPIQWDPEPAPCLLVQGVDRSGGSNRYVTPQRPPRVRPPILGVRRQVRMVLARAGLAR